MSYRVTLLPESRVGLVYGSGHVTGRELVDACRLMLGDARWEPGFDEVWDLTDAREVDVTPEELDALVESAHDLADRFADNRTMFVTTKDSMTVLVRLYERLTADLDRTYRVVRTVADAAEWLGLDPAALADGGRQRGGESGGG